MEWQDEGFILGTRRHGESSVIVEAMTRAHGRYLGLVRGGRGKRMQPLLQTGTQAQLVWRARLDEHLGTFTVEPLKLCTGALMASAEALHAICHAAALLRLSAERDPQPELYAAAARIAAGLDEPETLPPDLVRFEAEVLARMGFGLDLTRCAATGISEDLIYVSPRSGRAVSRAAGEPYKLKLMPLPGFLRGASESKPSPGDVMDGFRLTGFFLMRRLFGPRGLFLPEARDAYLAAIQNRFANEFSGY
ncbi:MAG TPA: DNA repair protein RecO [Methylocella sp.]|nr:DNA repair protein RecO [Methylocella sp.]